MFRDAQYVLEEDFEEVTDHPLLLQGEEQTFATSQEDIVEDLPLVGMD